MIDLKQVRRINFQQLVAKYGGQTEVAHIIDRKKSQINALCKGRVSIGDNLARTIEAEFKLEQLALDQPPKYIEGKARVIPVYALTGCLNKNPEDILTYIASDRTEENLLAILIQGDMLEPDYPQGTLFIVEETDKVAHGDMVVVTFDINKKASTPTFRYIYISEEGENGLVPINLMNKPEFNISYKIFGVVRTAIFDIEKPRFEF